MKKAFIIAMVLLLSSCGVEYKLMFDPLEKYEHAEFSATKSVNESCLGWLNQDVCLYGGLDVYEYSLISRQRTSLFDLPNIFSYIPTQSNFIELGGSVWRVRNYQGEEIARYDMSTNYYLMFVTEKWTAVFSTNDFYGAGNKTKMFIVMETNGTSNLIIFDQDVITVAGYYDYLGSADSFAIYDEKIYLPTDLTGALYKIDLENMSYTNLSLFSCLADKHVHFVSDISRTGRYLVIFYGDDSTMSDYPDSRVYASGYGIVDLVSNRLIPLFTPSEPLINNSSGSCYMIQESGGKISPDLTKLMFYLSHPGISDGETTTGRPLSDFPCSYYIDISSLNLTE